jgi:hypothetical protein
MGVVVPALRMTPNYWRWSRRRQLVDSLRVPGKRLIYSFTGTPDGQYPTTGLVRDTAGILYAT